MKKITQNAMLRINDNGEIRLAPIDAYIANDVAKMLEEHGVGKVTDIYQVGTVPFDILPDDIKEECLDTLKAFDRVHVTYENGKFDISSGIGIYSHYPMDFFPCGTYCAKDLYTEEQRKANYIECFG